MTNTLETNDGRKVWVHRANTATGSLSATLYLPPTKMTIGVDGIAPTLTTTTLNKTIPLSDGTPLDDGSNTFTGSSGADNSTDNTVTFKAGAGLTDVTAQNLLADGTGTNVLKTYTIADLASAGSNATATSYTGVWLYILNSTILATIVSVEFKLGSDASNYYSKTVLNANLAVGWNWISWGVLNTNTETGTVGATIDTYIIDVTTGSAGDEFAAGDLVTDLLRQWVLADTLQALISGYPVIDYTALKATHAFLINTLQANGFLVDNVAMWNEDTTPLMTTAALFTEGESKSNTDEFRILFNRRAI